MKKVLILIIPALFFFFSSFALSAITAGGGMFGCCVGSSNTLIDSGFAGGTWSSSTTSIATIDSMGNVYGVSAGTTTITYTLGSSYVTATFTVSVRPAAITGPTSVCPGASITMSDATAGGVWSNELTGVATISSTGVVTGITDGFNEIFYSSGPWCFVMDTIIVGTSGGAILYISGDSIVCAGSSTPFTASISGGTWSSSSAATATVSSSGTVSGVSAGTAIITYSVTGSCGTTWTTFPITVSETTSPGTISGSSTAFAGDIYYYYISGASASGTWSSSATTVATIDASGAMTAVSAGTTTLSYAVTGCGGTEYATFTVTVSAINRISGDIHFSSGAIDTTGGGVIKVWLITYNSSTLDLEAADSTYVTIDSTGTIAHYQFLGEVADSYRVKAAYFPGTFTAMGYIPTYHTSSLHWSSADVFAHTTTIANDGIDINMIYGSATTGPGFVGGNVTSGANRGTSSAIPVVGLLMMAINSSTGALVQQAYTDASGNYSFTTLPTGATYFIYPESINYATTPYTGITLTSSSSTFSTANFIKHTISKTITPVNEATSIVANLQTSVVVFPNPSYGKINIQYQGNTAAKGSILITDLNGREVYSSEITMNKGTGTQSLNLSSLRSGMYIINIKAGDLNYTNKIQIEN